MSASNRQWILVRRPQQALSETDFALREAAMPVPDLAAGEVLVRNLLLGFDASQREWLKDQEGYMPPMQIGELMRGFSIAQVLRSENPAYPEGSLLQGLFGWQEYALIDKNQWMPPVPLPAGLPPEMALSAMGATTLTAYFGLLAVGELQAGQTVVVSAAAGATGSAAVQIARLKGARVIGIAGGAEKCAWVCSDLGAEAAIDYRNQNVAERLAALCPEGINLYFDNVGGSILEAAIGNMARHGRIVLCGQISAYDAATPPAGPSNLMTLIYRGVRMEGFLMLDFLDRSGTAMGEIGGWLADGSMIARSDIQEGFENIPRTLMRLFRGENRGKQLLKLADPA